jgi:hypothetical protein
MAEEEKGTTRIPDHRIRDVHTFNEVTKDPHHIAGLYFFFMSDCLVDLSYKVSHDFFRRPHLYINLHKAEDEEDSIAQRLAELHARYGSHEAFLSKSQRDEIYGSLFGKKSSLAEEDDDFPRLRNALVNACSAFAERVFDTGVEMLQERVRSTHRPFQEYLTGLLGDSIKWSKHALYLLAENQSYKILRNQGIAAVFGISTPPEGEWPYAEDSNADKLVEEISKQLGSLDETGVENVTEKSKNKYISREQISNLQRAALRGAEALAVIIDFNERDDHKDNASLHRLITKSYTWGSALLSLKPYQNMGDGGLRVYPGIARRAE